jgi:hypothetical protein
MINCPICGSVGTGLARTGDAEGYDCHTHGKFKVSGSVLSSESYSNAGREKWESALVRAKSRTGVGDWPVIRTSDF